jgi:hypothetical protein
VSWFAAIVFRNITSIGEVELGGERSKGLHLGILEELEFATVEFSPLPRRKKEERSKHSIENLSETCQKSEKS